jgi:hypothetical protein
MKTNRVGTLSMSDAIASAWSSKGWDLSELSTHLTTSPDIKWGRAIFATSNAMLFFRQAIEAFPWVLK